MVKSNYGCLECGAVLGKLSLCVSHMRTCCPHRLAHGMKGGLQFQCKLGSPKCIVPGHAGLKIPFSSFHYVEQQPAAKKRRQAGSTSPTTASVATQSDAEQEQREASKDGMIPLESKKKRKDLGFRGGICVLPKSMNVFERYFTALFMSHRGDIEKSNGNDEVRTRLMTQICGRLSLPLPAKLPPSDSNKKQFYDTRYVVMSESWGCMRHYFSCPILKLVCAVAQRCFGNGRVPCYSSRRFSKPKNATKAWRVISPSHFATYVNGKKEEWISFDV